MVWVALHIYFVRTKMSITRIALNLIGPKEKPARNSIFKWSVVEHAFIHKDVASRKH